MSRPPEFDDLVEVADARERDRLRQVHDLLVAAGPPPELSPALATVPAAPATEDDDAVVTWLPRRRMWTSGIAAAAALVAAFGVGYLAADRGTEERTVPPPPPAAEVVSLRPADQNNTAGASIRLGRRGPDGNWPMTITVRGLDHLTGGDYYTLVLMKKGKPAVTCGTFNVGQEGTTTVRMIAAYDLDEFEGWAITRYHAETHADEVVMTET